MPERCLLIHGHFYQPPRENPWTGKIDPQFSAAPWQNWNLRITDECYIPMARSRVFNTSGRVTDLYNNYAHTSFNFGPTLLSWLAANNPDTVRRLREATVVDRTFALAQVYSHIMLPLANERDRHTQILWGLREFHHRFGFYPGGMWLSECGLDNDSLRALIDHGIGYVILSPHQASKARPFGQAEWRNVAMGAVDTRRAYRLFEVDGGGRTHFDRYLDVIFYTPGLNLKVSFDHLLNRPDDLARELENCYRPDFPGSQLVSIVTDGEIYGHHEKDGEVALSRLFREIAPQLGLNIVSAGAFIRDNPPSWEVKLWGGEDGRGSSWSCAHGVGRWFRDCGCTPPAPPGWNQRWRGPLRSAFDAIRDRVDGVARRELGSLLWDVDDARDDYIAIVLDPGQATRAEFIRRHAQRALNLSEVERLWSILEATHNAMLMYASCGWFFDEVSGLEPVQNMRYALRAAELVQPWSQENLIELLEEELSQAKSNIHAVGDGGKIFREMVLPSRHSNRELAAAMAVCLAAEFPIDSLSWRVVAKTETVNYSDNQGNQIAWGSFVCHDARLDRFIKASWLARLNEFDNSAVVLKDYDEIQGDPLREESECPWEPDIDFAWLRQVKSSAESLSRQELLARFDQHGIAYDRLPEAIRGMLYRRFSGTREMDLQDEVAAIGARAVPFLARARRHGARVPDAIVKTVTSAFEQEISQTGFSVIASGEYNDAAVASIERSRNSARELGLQPSLDLASQSVRRTGLEMLAWMARLSTRDWLDSLRPSSLPGGGEWLAPVARANRDLAYPTANGLSLAMGRGLAILWRKLSAQSDPGRYALMTMPLPEALDFAVRAGLGPEEWTDLGIAYWDFLDAGLPGLIADDPAGLLSGEAGDRIRRAGVLLGFAEDSVEKRLLQAARKGIMY